MNSGVVDDDDAVDAAPSLMPGNKLDKFQMAGVTTDPHKPLIILASPGSGKTTTLCSRICFLVEQCRIETRHILAITFSNRAAHDMRQKLSVLRPVDSSSSLYQFVTIKTFHSFCLHILRETDRIDKHATVLDSTDQKKLIKQCLEEYVTAQSEQNSSYPLPSQPLANSSSKISARVVDGKDTKSVKDKGKDIQLVDETELDAPITPAQVKKAYTRITRDKMRLRTPNHYAAGSERRHVWETYERKKKQDNCVDFDDMLCLFVSTLRQDKELQEQIRTRFPYVLVDEYQDTNNLQLEVIKLVSRNISIVGDDDQSIYGWRGAEVRNWSRFKNAYPDAHSVQLVNNYRSGRCIVEVCNTLIKSNDTRLKRQEMVCLPTHTDLCIVASCYNMTEEAEVVATEIVTLHKARGIPYREMSILYRSNPQSVLSRALEKSLLAHDIPYVIVRGTELFERKVIKDLLSFCTLIVNPKDNLAFSRVFTLIPGLGKLSWYKFRKYVEKSSAARKARSDAENSDSVPCYLPTLLSYDFDGKIGTDRFGVHLDVKGRALKQLAYLQMLFVKWGTFTKDAAVEEDRCAGDVIRLVMDDLKMPETFKEDEEELVNILIAEASRPEKFTDIERQDLSISPSEVGSDSKTRTKHNKRTAFDRLHLFLERVSFGEVMKGGKRIAPRSKNASAIATTDDADGDCVTLSTIHSAKGLEWRCVFGLHLADGTFPRYAAKSSDDDSDQEGKGSDNKDTGRNRIEEERRVAYVLCSRAKEVLHLSIPKLPYNKQPLATPSIFIEEIRAKCSRFIVFRENAAAHVRKRAQERDKREKDDKRAAQASQQDKKDQRQHERQPGHSEKPDDRKSSKQVSESKQKPQTSKRKRGADIPQSDTRVPKRHNFFSPVPSNSTQWSCTACTLINYVGADNGTPTHCRLCGTLRRPMTPARG